MSLLKDRKALKIYEREKRRREKEKKRPRTSCLANNKLYLIKLYINIYIYIRGGKWYVCQVACESTNP